MKPRRKPSRPRAVPVPVVPVRIQYCAKESCILLGISVRLLWDLASKKELPVVRVGSRCFWRHVDLVAFSDAHVSDLPGKPAPLALVAKNRRAS